jgi:hypothetical protein
MKMRRINIVTTLGANTLRDAVPKAQIISGR